MNWYKESQSNHMDLLLNFYNYLTNSEHDRKYLQSEIIYLYHTPEDSIRHKSVSELMQAVLGELNIRFQNILAIPREFFEYYSKGQSYFTHGSPIDALMKYIEKSKKIIDKVNVERKTLDYESKYNIYEFQESIKNLNSALSGLERILKYAIIENNDLGERVKVQEFSQLETNKEPVHKEVRRDEKPPWGHGWMIENPTTGEMEWWKTSWDTSD